MNIFELTRREWPTTLFAWYGDPGFAKTLLDELGWRVASEIDIDESAVVGTLFDDISDTIASTQHSDRLFLRSVSRWNMLAWRNDTGGALLHLEGMPLAMPVFEITLSEEGGKSRCVVGLGAQRRVLDSSEGLVDIESTLSAPGNQTPQSWIGDDGEPFGAQWRLTLVNSIGVPSSKVVSLYSDPVRTLTELGASLSLFEFSTDSPGRLSLLTIDDLEE